MRLVTFEVNTVVGKLSRLGLWQPTGIIDLRSAYETMLVRQNRDRQFSGQLANLLFGDMMAYFRAGETGRQAAEDVQNWLPGFGDNPGVGGAGLAHKTEDVRLLAPVRRPASIRDFSTFEQHQQRVTKAKSGGEVPQVWYEIPVYWKANPQNVAGPDDDILWPAYSNRLDYELELGAFIGKTGKDISIEAAGDFIAGYTIYNDVSARDHQAREMVMTFGPAKGKDFDTSNVLGPCVVTPDEFGEDSHRMVARINGEIWSEGWSGDMFWSFRQLVAYSSQSETLAPGDLLGSGACPTGCGLEIDRWIQPGDVVELEIEGIGVLRNRVVRV